MKQHFALLSTLLVLVSGVAVTLLAQETPGQSVRLQSLMLEREEVLRNRAEMLEMLVKSGSTKPIEAIDAHRDLIAARIELSESKNERLKLLEEVITNRNEAEIYFAELKKVGQASDANIMLAKSNRLLAENNLVREASATP